VLATNLLTSALSDGMTVAKLAIEYVLYLPVIHDERVNWISVELAGGAQHPEPEGMERGDADLVAFFVLLILTHLVDASPQVVGRGASEGNSTDCAGRNALAEEPANTFLNGGGLPGAGSSYEANLRRRVMGCCVLNGLGRTDLQSGNRHECTLGDALHGCWKVRACRRIASTRIPEEVYSLF
jgi:hypothetical protein